jgi:hypothetical protein
MVTCSGFRISQTCVLTASHRLVDGERLVPAFETRVATSKLRLTDPFGFAHSVVRRGELAFWSTASAAGNAAAKGTAANTPC